MSDEIILIDATLKARMAIRALRNSGLDVPIGFNEDEAIAKWAEALAPFDGDDVTAAVGQWIMHNAKFPTLEQFIPVCQRATRQTRVKDAPLDDDCSECEGDRYVTVIDSVEKIETFASKQKHRKKDGSDDGIMEEREYIDYPHRHKRPCSLCYPERYDLYMRGHWDEGHSPCPKCRKYREPWRRGK